MQISVQKLIYKVTMYFAVLLSALCMNAKADQSSASPSGLLVTFESNGKVFQKTVTAHDSVDYVLQYVAGQAPKKNVALEDTTARFVEACESGQVACSDAARIMRVQDCRSGQCTRLKGLYGGRTPAI